MSQMQTILGANGQIAIELARELRRKYTTAFLPFTSYAVTDGRLVTGQNPYSGKAVAHALLKAMEEKK